MIPKDKMRLNSAIWPAILTIALGAYSSSARAPDISSMSLEEKAMFEELRSTSRRLEFKKSIDEILELYPTMNLEEARAIAVHNNQFEIRHYELRKDAAMTGTTTADAKMLLNDESLMQKFPWATYDQLPREVSRVVLDRMFRDNARVLDSQFIVDYDAFMKIPEPVLVAKYVKEISRWVSYWEPKRTTEEKRMLEDFSIAIMLVESFATRRAVAAPEPSLQGKIRLDDADFGIFQISPEARQKLKRVSDFKGYSDLDYLSPGVSIKAGTYWFLRCVREAKNELLTGSACYNAGLAGAMEKTLRSQEYLSMVLARHDKYILNGASDTFNYILEIARR
jgi:hypothetical protein